MKVLITGNLGYVGPVLIQELRTHQPGAFLTGYDIGYFAQQLTCKRPSPAALADDQYFGDVRQFPERLLEGVDAVVSLAAISNDPIGNRFEEATMEINYQANVNLARMARCMGVKKFVFASSCSVYGSAEDTPRSEESALDPLTAYARSKVYSEEALQGLAGENFQVTCLRFATACGMSERLRLDLVLNDFVAGAIANGKISIFSDGTPWRPLISVQDMARAFRWALERDSRQGGHFLTVNTGSNDWNFQVRELAMETQKLLPEVDIFINPNAQPDKRSYRVSFDRFSRLAPDHQPQFSLMDTVMGLISGMKEMDFCDPNYHQSDLIRLNVINSLLQRGRLNHSLALAQGEYQPAASA